MTAFTIVLEEREFPSDRVLNIRMEEFEPEVMESRDSGVYLARQAYRLRCVRSLESDVGLGPLPRPWGSDRCQHHGAGLGRGDVILTCSRSAEAWTPASPLFFLPCIRGYYVVQSVSTLTRFPCALRNLRVWKSPVSGSRWCVDGRRGAAGRSRLSAPRRRVV
jgi:hypothetical protein